MGAGGRTARWRARSSTGRCSGRAEHQVPSAKSQARLHERAPERTVAPARSISIDHHRTSTMRALARLALPLLLAPAFLGGQQPDAQKLATLKAELSRAIDGKAKMAQQMVDQVFSFGELGMQE